MYICLHVKYRLFLSDFNDILNFLGTLSGEKKLQISNFMKIRQMEAELFHADGQRERET